MILIFWNASRLCKGHVSQEELIQVSSLISPLYQMVHIKYPWNTTIFCNISFMGWGQLYTCALLIFLRAHSVPYLNSRICHAILMLQGITIYRYSDSSCRIYGCGMWNSTSTVCKEETWEWRCVSVCCWTVNVYSILIRFYGGVSVQHAYYLGMYIKVIWYCITSLGWLWLARQYELFCKLGLYHCSFIPIKK